MQLEKQLNALVNKEYVWERKLMPFSTKNEPWSTKWGCDEKKMKHDDNIILTFQKLLLGGMIREAASYLQGIRGFTSCMF